MDDDIFKKVDPSRREFLKRLLGAAFSAPMLASCAMDGFAPGPGEGLQGVVSPVEYANTSRWGSLVSNVSSQTFPFVSWATADDQGVYWVPQPGPAFLVPPAQSSNSSLRVRFPSPSAASNVEVDLWTIGPGCVRLANTTYYTNCTPYYISNQTYNYYGANTSSGNYNMFIVPATNVDGGLSIHVPVSSEQSSQNFHFSIFDPNTKTIYPGVLSYVNGVVSSVSLPPVFSLQSTPGQDQGALAFMFGGRTITFV